MSKRANKSDSSEVKSATERISYTSHTTLSAGRVIDQISAIKVPNIVVKHIGGVRLVDANVAVPEGTYTTQSVDEEKKGKLARQGVVVLPDIYNSLTTSTWSRPRRITAHFFGKNKYTFLELDGGVVLPGYASWLMRGKSEDVVANYLLRDRVLLSLGDLNLVAWYCAFDCMGINVEVLTNETAVKNIEKSRIVITDRTQAYE